MRASKLKAIDAIHEIIMNDMEFDNDIKKEKAKEKQIFKNLANYEAREQKKKLAEAKRYLMDMKKKEESALKKIKRDKIVNDTFNRVILYESIRKINEIIGSYDGMDFCDDFECFCDYYDFKFHHYREWYGGAMLSEFIKKLKEWQLNNGVQSHTILNDDEDEDTD